MTLYINGICATFAQFKETRTKYLKVLLKPKGSVSSCSYFRHLANFSILSKLVPNLGRLFLQFETNSCFHVKWRTTGKVQNPFFKNFWPALEKILFRKEDWEPVDNSGRFRDLPDFS